MNGSPVCGAHSATQTFIQDIMANLSCSKSLRLAARAEADDRKKLEVGPHEEHKEPQP
jgi:hypothetical protein